MLHAEPGLTVGELLAHWPPDSPPPRFNVLHRHLARALAENELIRTGAGHRYEPYRYRVAEEASGSEAAEGNGVA